MAAPGVADEVQKGAGAYWRDLVFSRLLPALFFSVFLARQLLFLWDGLHSVPQPYDYLFVLQQALALAYFTLLVVLYSTRLPKRGTDHRAAVVFIAFTGTFSAIVAPFLPGGGHRVGVVLAGDLLATFGLAYSVWGLAYLRRSFSIIPEARRLVTGPTPPAAAWRAARPIVFFIGCEPLRIGWEEGVLARAFPNDYPAYA